MKKILFLGLSLFLFQGINAQVHDSFKNQGFFNITKISYIDVQNATFDEYTPSEGTVSTDLPTETAKAYSLQTIGGYFLNPYLSIGAGIGLDGYHEPDHNTMPLFIDIRGYLVNNKNSAFVFLDVGTLLNAGALYRRGNMLEVGVGYKFFASSRIAMIGSIDGSFKGLSLTDEGYRTADRTVVLRGVGVSIGLIF